MIKQFEQYLLNLAYATVKDFLDYTGYEGEVMIGYTNSFGQEIDDCIQITDDEGHAVFLIFVDSLDNGTYNGIMCEGHKAPGEYSDDDFRLKYSKSNVSPVGAVRWGLGI